MTGTIELQLYDAVLLLSGAVNLLMAVLLIHNNYWYSNYGVYHRARVLVAVTYAVFAVGFLLHSELHWRLTWTAAASALSVSYFHIGGVLFGWSHTSLLRPDYLTRRVVARDLIILTIGLVCYWTALLLPCSCCPVQYAIFFAHAGFIAYTFYRTYYRVRKDIMHVPSDADAPSWWTPEMKRTVLSSHHSFIIACHLIILFGLGGILFTALLPTAVWPYTLLLVMGICVFSYIFYSLTEYGLVIESAANITEDVERMKH